MAMEDQLNISVERKSEFTVVAISGSVNMMDVDAFRQQLLSTIESEQGQDLIIDLSQMNFINSLGLGVLVAAQREMKRVQHRLKLVQPQAGVQKMLETTKLTRLFAIYPDTDAAIASAQAQG